MKRSRSRITSLLLKTAVDDCMFTHEVLKLHILLFDTLHAPVLSGGLKGHVVTSTCPCPFT